jgi:hypothetical protein
LPIPPIVVIAVVIWVASFAVAAGWLARDRDRLVPLWAAYGAVLGPLALLLLWAAPHGHCRTCHMKTQGWATTCPWCHEDVNTVPSTARRAIHRAEPQASPGRRPLPGSPSAAVPSPLERSPAGPAASNPVPLPAKAPAPQATRRRDVVIPIAQRPAAPVQAARPNPPVTTGRIAVAPQARAAGDDSGSDPQTEILATATYVTGTARLDPGQRYGIALRGSRLLILGPVDLEPERIVVDRPVADIEVNALEGRLLISEQTRSGLVLAFMSVSESGPDGLSGAIRSAARNARP